jgi:hypothetical protein
MVTPRSLSEVDLSNADAKSDIEKFEREFAKTAG